MATKPLDGQMKALKSATDSVPRMGLYDINTPQFIYLLNIQFLNTIIYGHPINQIKKGISGIRESTEYLKNNYSIALMIDQRVSEGKKIPFFRQDALTTTLPAQLALKHKCNIVPIYIARNKDDSFEMEIYDPIKTSDKDRSEKNKMDISLALNKIIEKMILRDPGQWIWTNNRWK